MNSFVDQKDYLRSNKNMPPSMRGANQRKSSSSNNNKKNNNNKYVHQIREMVAKKMVAKIMLTIILLRMIIKISLF